MVISIYNLPEKRSRMRAVRVAGLAGLICCVLGLLLLAPVNPASGQAVPAPTPPAVTPAASTPDNGPTNYEYYLTFHTLAPQYYYDYGIPDLSICSICFGGRGRYVRPVGYRRFAGGYYSGYVRNGYSRPARNIEVQLMVTSGVSSAPVGTSIFTIPLAMPGDDTPFNSPTFIFSDPGPSIQNYKLRILKVEWGE